MAWQLIDYATGTDGWNIIDWRRDEEALILTGCDWGDTATTVAQQANADKWRLFGHNGDGVFTTGDPISQLYGGRGPGRYSVSMELEDDDGSYVELTTRDGQFEAVDLTQSTDSTIRFYIFIPELRSNGTATVINRVELQIGENISNFYEWELQHDGTPGVADLGPGLNAVSVDFTSTPDSTTGSFDGDFTSVTFIGIKVWKGNGAGQVFDGVRVDDVHLPLA